MWEMNHLLHCSYLLLLLRADGSNEQCSGSSDAGEGNVPPSSNQSPLTSGPSETSHDVDKQERIERYVRMTIQNQVESRLAQTSVDLVSQVYSSLPDQHTKQKKC